MPPPPTPAETPCGARVHHRQQKPPRASLRDRRLRTLARPDLLHRLQNGRAGQHQIGPIGPDARLAGALSGIQTQQTLGHRLAIGASQPESIDLPRTVIARQAQVQAGKAGDRARSANRARLAERRRRRAVPPPGRTPRSAPPPRPAWRARNHARSLLGRTSGNRSARVTIADGDRDPGADRRQGTGPAAAYRPRRVPSTRRRHRAPARRLRRPIGEGVYAARHRERRLFLRGDDLQPDAAPRGARAPETQGHWPRRDRSSVAMPARSLGPPRRRSRSAQTFRAARARSMAAGCRRPDWLRPSPSRTMRE